MKKWWKNTHTQKCKYPSTHTCPELFLNEVKSKTELRPQKSLYANWHYANEK